MHSTDTEESCAVNAMNTSVTVNIHPLPYVICWRKNTPNQSFIVHETDSALIYANLCRSPITAFNMRIWIQFSFWSLCEGRTLLVTAAARSDTNKGYHWTGGISIGTSLYTNSMEKLCSIPWKQARSSFCLSMTTRRSKRRKQSTYVWAGQW